MITITAFRLKDKEKTGKKLKLYMFLRLGAGNRQKRAAQRGECIEIHFFSGENAENT